MDKKINSVPIGALRLQDYLFVKYSIFLPSIDSMSAKGATVLSEAKTQSDDPLKDRGLSQKKQFSLEVQRISSILENCISQVEIAATLHAVLRSNSASGVADQDLSRALQEHQMLEERLETLERLKQESDGEQEGEARERAKVQLEKDIKNSVRNLLRIVRARPDAMGLRAELVMEVGESEYILIRELQKFHCHMVEKLLTIVDEELQLVLYKQVPSPPAFNLEHMVSVEEGLATAMKEVDAKVRHQVGY